MAEKALSSAERDEVERLLANRHKERAADLDAAHPGWRAEFDVRLRKLAIGFMSIEKDVAESERLQGEIEKLQKQLQVVDKRIEAKMPFKKPEYSGQCGRKMSLCEAVEARVEQIRESELRQHPVGKLLHGLQLVLSANLRKFAKCATREAIQNSGILDDDKEQPVEQLESPTTTKTRRK